MNRPELRPLTSVRGLFAWAVVLYHVRISCAAWLPAGVMTVLTRGYLAVDFFFLLSGFVIWLNYGERLATGGRAAAADFLVRRLARIWPLYLAMLAFAVLIAATLLATGREAPHFPFALLPLHAALMQNWGASNALMWNDPAWSISAEWAAYLLTPLAALALPGRRTWRAPALLAAAALPLLVLTATLALTGADRLGADVSHFGILRCVAEFGCGSVLSDLWRRWRGDVRAEIAAWLAGLACLASWAAGVHEILCVPFAFASLLLALALGAERPRNPLAGRAIHWLGEISYATYLSHFLLFIVFKLAVVRDAHDVSPAQIGLFLLIVLAASAVLYHGIERPAQRFVLLWWRSRGAAAPADLKLSKGRSS
jgi:peptidoglycan/LPS O-acetylase OafA/YrhL